MSAPIRCRGGSAGGQVGPELGLVGLPCERVHAGVCPVQVVEDPGAVGRVDGLVVRGTGTVARDVDHRVLDAFIDDARYVAHQVEHRWRHLDARDAGDLAVDHDQSIAHVGNQVLCHHLDDASANDHGWNFHPLGQALDGVIQVAAIQARSRLLPKDAFRDPGVAVADAGEDRVVSDGARDAHAYPLAQCARNHKMQKHRWQRCLQYQVPIPDTLRM